jgi:hypothetical protein
MAGVFSTPRTRQALRIRAGTSASFCDYDRDGDLTLRRALRRVHRRQIACAPVHRHRDYCSPEAYPPERDHLLRNEGDGRFST